LILLDLNLPGTDGREVLRRIKQDDHLKTIPVIILTTSNNPKDIKACYQHGVNSYVIKPMDFKVLKHSIQTLLSYWFEITMLPSESLEDNLL
jgi:CheY-like chemotaxis protein